MNDSDVGYSYEWDMEFTIYTKIDEYLQVKKVDCDQSDKKVSKQNESK